MARDMNILVLSDNSEILMRARPIFERRKHQWTFSTSDEVNPKTDYYHIQKYYELVFSLHCKTIFPKILTSAVRCVNVHPGFNPYNRGIFPHIFSIVNGLPAGVTIHEMTEEIDLGPCIAQTEVSVKDCDTSGSLYERIIDCELELLDYMLPSIIDKKYKLFEYTDKGNYNSMADFKKLCNFNLFDSGCEFYEVFNTMRALSHPGYLNAHYNGIKFKLIIDGTDQINPLPTHKQY
jgi:methionyl-tRNA formyltransferase